MARKKRHSSAEISAKIAQANELAAQGKLQTDIASTIGVSVMTLHRWRKMFPAHSMPTTSAGSPEPVARRSWRNEEASRIAELKLENSRLRRLVTDLMLEKINLEEADQNDDYFPHRASKPSRVFPTRWPSANKSSRH